MFAGKAKGNPRSGSFTKGAQTCWNCGKKGHTNRDCRAKRFGDGTSFKPVRKALKKHDTSDAGVTSDDMLALFGSTPMLNSFTMADSVEVDSFLLAAIGDKAKTSVVWMLDTGASDHVCNDRSLFDKVHTLSTAQVYKTAGQDIAITEGGTISMDLDGGLSHLVLDNVQLRARHN
ncbi:hypothetical protein QFC24_005252 [Naganishia onofrii]|uniref:Uncharacterized protein n=1 Tax=Naganishia onofrii TaxID=1851511 RepID=A0ACC2XB96_9TREE|nr:hypothetical protein QFC24_005252 [Naganishia onofrii]